MLVIRDLAKAYSSGVQRSRESASSYIRVCSRAYACHFRRVETSEGEQDSFIFEFLKASRRKTIKSCRALTAAPVFTQWLQDSEDRHLASKVSLVQFLPQNRFIDLG
jgi:hypothetical protein